MGRAPAPGPSAPCPPRTGGSRAHRHHDSGGGTAPSSGRAAPGSGHSLSTARVSVCTRSSPATPHRWTAPSRGGHGHAPALGALPGTSYPDPPESEERGPNAGTPRLRPHRTPPSRPPRRPTRIPPNSIALFLPPDSLRPASDLASPNRGVKRSLVGVGVRRGHTASRAQRRLPLPDRFPLPWPPRLPLGRTTLVGEPFSPTASSWAGCVRGALDEDECAAFLNAAMTSPFSSMSLFYFLSFI